MINAKAYMMQYARTMERIRELREDIEHIESVATSMQINMDGMPHGHSTSDKVGNVSARAADMQSDLQHELLAALELRDEIRQVVNRIPSTRHARLMSRRYIELEDGGRMRTWESIAEEMGYDYDWVKSGLHSQALEMVRQILENDETTH